MQPTVRLGGSFPILSGRPDRLGKPASARAIRTSLPKAGTFSTKAASNAFATLIGRAGNQLLRSHNQLLCSHGAGEEEHAMGSNVRRWYLLTVGFCVAALLASGHVAFGQKPSPDQSVREYANGLLAEGMRTFRFDTPSGAKSFGAENSNFITPSKGRRTVAPVRASVRRKLSNSGLKSTWMLFPRRSPRGSRAVRST